MTTDQPYREAMSSAEALSRLMAGRGTKYDADAVDALVALIRDNKLAEAA